MQTEPLEAKPQPGCFACGPQNPHGLKLRFVTEDGVASCAEWIPEPHLEGFQGIVHGGIVTTVLDEAMAKAVVARGLQALTVEIRVRLRKHVSAGERFSIRGWVVEQQRRKISTEAALFGRDGEEHAHAWAAFLLLDGA